MTDPGPAESRRVRDTHLPGRLAGQTVREADRALRLHGGGEGLLDTTHFDTVRFPSPPWAADVMCAAASDGELAYTPYRGHPGVLDALAGPLAALLGVPVDPSTCSASGCSRSWLPASSVSRSATTTASPISTSTSWSGCCRSARG